MDSPKTITISLDYLFAPNLVISACFSVKGTYGGSKLETCINNALRYSTVHSSIYLFPVFREIAKQAEVGFSIRYNTVLNPFRYFYAGLRNICDYFVTKKGIDEYMKRMKVKDV